MDPKKENFLYIQVYNTLRKQIEEEEFQPGEKLPTEHELKERYQVSRDTIRKTLQKLEQDGMITRIAAKGTFVNLNKANYPLTRMESFSEMMRKRGFVPSSDLISIKLITQPNSHLIEILAINHGEKLYEVRRIRKADGKPMAYEIAYIPETLCPNLQIHLVDNCSLYEIYEKVYQLSLGEATISLEAETGNRLIEEILKIKKNASLLKMKCIMHLKDSRPLYYVECFYIGERYFFTTRLSR